MALPRDFILLFRQFLIGNTAYSLDKITDFTLVKNGFGFRHEEGWYEFSFDRLTARPVDEIRPLNFSRLSIEDRQALYWKIRETHLKAHENGLDHFFRQVLGQGFPKERKEPITYTPKDIAHLAQMELWEIVEGKSYPLPLPSDIEPLYVYLSDWGHSVIAIDSLLCYKEADPALFMLPVPVKTLLRQGYIIRYGMVYSPFENDELGSLLIREGEQEF